MTIIFSITIFLSAFLIFSVQPMIGKMVIPIYGGAPSTWNVCMFFFQVTLLAGYTYAHFAMKYFSFKRQVSIVFIMFFLSFILLPFFTDKYTMVKEIENPAIQLFGRLFLTVGFPLIAISGLSPLLQRWFSLSKHHYSTDPYFLYTSSNVGSMIALFFYPFILERFFTINDQNNLWVASFGLLGIMVLICGFMTRKTKNFKQNVKQTAISKQMKITWKNRFFWLFAAFVPSSLMLGVTTYIITDLPAIPMLYVLPLALYLFSFALAFSRKVIIPHQFVTRIIPFILIMLVPSFFSLTKAGLVLVPLHLLMFFFVALGCHGELAKSRPPAENLTEFYLFISIGGALGGMFNALICPLIFDRILEYPLATFLSCLVVTTFRDGAVKNLRQVSLFGIFFPVILFFISVAIMRTAILSGVNTTAHLFMLFIIVCLPMGFATFRLKNRPFRFALCYAMLLISVGLLADITHGEDEYISRNFYGVKKIKVDKSRGLRSLIHGVTVHGRQYVNKPYQDIPLAYFHESGPIGDIFRAHRKEKPLSDIAVVGLGVGTIAGYTKPWENITFYEIDPGIIKIATSPRFFTFLSNSKGSYSIVTGDARLKLHGARNKSYDMILLDAFASNAIPIHLLTREAIDLYLSKIKPNGFLVFHISNKYINLKHMIARHAVDNGLTCIYTFDFSDGKDYLGKISSEYAVIGKPGSIIKSLLQIEEWRVVEPDQDVVAWTDMYSSLLNYLKL